MVAAIVGVLVATIVFVFLMLRVARFSERAERDRSMAARPFVLLAVIYSAGMLFGLIGVATGEAPRETLVGLPIAILFVWACLKQVKRIRSASATNSSNR
jgi:L-asparagine transporter-like permease